LLRYPHLMCGRFTLAVEQDDLLRFFGIPVEAWEKLAPYHPRTNIAPTQQVLTIGADGPLAPALMRWGLIPSWRKPGQKLPLAINARAETVATNGMFRNAYRRQRCLIPADGFYEWQMGDREKPYRIGMNGWGLFAFAGLWERWEDSASGEVTRSTTILTCPPNELCAGIHDRMPVILPLDAYERWLDPANRDGHGLEPLLAPYPAELMDAYRVGTAVNSVKNTGPELVEAAP
jgi:putative SOS response-associated peptidase YedK